MIPYSGLTMKLVITGTIVLLTLVPIVTYALLGDV